jgi:hypothetical protein
LFTGGAFDDGEFVHPGAEAPIALVPGADLACPRLGHGFIDFQVERHGISSLKV